MCKYSTLLTRHCSLKRTFGILLIGLRPILQALTIPRLFMLMSKSSKWPELKSSSTSNLLSFPMPVSVTQCRFGRILNKSMVLMDLQPALPFSVNSCVWRKVTTRWWIHRLPTWRILLIISTLLESWSLMKISFLHSQLDYRSCMPRLLSVVDFPYISLYMHPIRPQLWSPIVKTSLLTTTCKKLCIYS